MSRIGTISGGSPMMRRSPSTILVSFASAFVLSFVCAFSIVFWSILAPLRFVPPYSLSRRSASRRAYQTCRAVIAANAAIALR